MKSITRFAEGVAATSLGAAVGLGLIEMSVPAGLSLPIGAYVMATLLILTRIMYAVEESNR